MWVFFGQRRITNAQFSPRIKSDEFFLSISIWPRREGTADRESRALIIASIMKNARGESKTGAGRCISPDPSNLLSPSRQIVKVVNIARQDVNNRLAVATSYNLSERGRYAVKFSDQSVMAFRPENLQKATKIEKVRFHAQIALDGANPFRNDPRLRSQFKAFYTNLKERMPRYLPPELAAFLYIVSILIALVAWGFSKTMILFSLASVPVVVSLKDMQAGLAAKQIIGNFPRNLRDAMAETTGWTGVSESVAMAWFVIFASLSYVHLWHTNVA